MLFKEKYKKKHYWQLYYVKQSHVLTKDLQILDSQGIFFAYIILLMN